MNKVTRENVLTKERVIIKTLDNGLTLYYCKKKGFKEFVGMLGTKYGSIDYDFISNRTGKRVKVEDGIAHFLEHKLFEQEDVNALDLFSRMGVSSNAYTTFDHTVYFFEANKNFNKCLEALFKFVSTPYFTYENVEKEKGIIEQELKMYEDEPQSVVYYRLLKNMYKNIHLNVDIGGTPESIMPITKERLYDCYETFYNPKNMFCIVIGDLEEEDVEKKANDFANKYMKNKSIEVVKFVEEEPYEVVNKESTKKMQVATNYICIGFKHSAKSGKENAKTSAIVDILNEASFGRISDFYENIYKEKLVNEPIQISYESGNNFGYTIIYIASDDYKKIEEETTQYIKELKKYGISQEVFDISKKKIIGDKIFETEDIMSIHREIIESIVENYDLFEYESELLKVSKEDVDNFIKNELNLDNMSISRVIK